MTHLISASLILSLKVHLLSPHHLTLSLRIIGILVLNNLGQYSCDLFLQQTHEFWLHVLVQVVLLAELGGQRFCRVSFIHYDSLNAVLSDVDVNIELRVSFSPVFVFWSLLISLSWRVRISFLSLMMWNMWFTELGRLALLHLLLSWRSSSLWLVKGRSLLDLAWELRLGFQRVRVLLLRDQWLLGRHCRRLVDILVDLLSSLLHTLSGAEWTSLSHPFLELGVFSCFLKPLELLVESFDLVDRGTLRNLLEVVLVNLWSKLALFFLLLIPVLVSLSVSFLVFAGFYI